MDYPIRKKQFERPRKSMELGERSDMKKVATPVLTEEEVFAAKVTCFKRKGFF